MSRNNRVAEMDDRRAIRLTRLAMFSRGDSKAGHIAVSGKAKSLGMSHNALTNGWGNRVKENKTVLEVEDHSRELAGREFEQNKKHFRDANVNSKTLSKVEEKVKAKLQTQTDYMNAYWGWVGIIQPEYELLEPWTIYDTESYVTRAVERKKSLMFRNGFQVIGNNETYRAYIEKRLQQISYFQNQTLENFFKDILVQLLVCSNCIVLKIRDRDASGGVANPKNKNKEPVAAYTIIPSHTIYPYLNGRGVIEKWRRFFSDGRTFQDYPIEDIIHFYWDKKAGHIFGTPRTAPVRDDILALRRLEENVELLMIHHLFPLFHIAVGTDEQPADYNIDGTSEIDFMRNDIEAMPKEGFLVTDERVKVEAVGAKGEALDYDSIIAHYKTRVFTGLGVSSVDMGEGDTANRGTAETVSQNLKDYVKADLDYFTGLAQMQVVKELFQEAPFDLSVQNAVADIKLAFTEIDVDGMIKMENAVTNLYNNNLVTETEARQKMHRQALTKEQHKETHYIQHTLDLALKTAKARGDAALAVAEAGAAEKAEIAAAPKKKVSATKSQPQNQHGKNLDPHKARSSMDPNFFKPLYDCLMQVREELVKDGKLINDEWQMRAPKLIYAFFNELVDEDVTNAYTNQARVKLDQVRDELITLVSVTYDPDLVSVVLRDSQFDLEDLDIEVIHGKDKRTSTDNGESQYGDGTKESTLSQVGEPGA